MRRAWNSSYRATHPNPSAPVGSIPAQHHTPIGFGQPVAGLDVTEDWVTLLTHHAVADGILLYHWFSTLWQNYAQILSGATVPEPAPVPVPAANETLLADAVSSRAPAPGRSAWTAWWCTRFAIRSAAPRAPTRSPCTG
ncbi:hypothetical protein H7H51_15635 [Mycolicibacterium farcinogenes]|nr:hypothetical protein [Mycolicibacterium farcinogenes]